MQTIVRDLQEVTRDLQLIAICGRTSKLADRIRAIPAHSDARCGFTSDIPYYMSLSDFFIGKPGPGSISEAMAMKLPVIVRAKCMDLAAGTLQRRLGARERRRTRCERLQRRPARLSPSYSSPAGFANVKANVAAINNRAVFEILDILEQILIVALRITPRQVRAAFQPQIVLAGHLVVAAGTGPVRFQTEPAVVPVRQQRRYLPLPVDCACRADPRPACVLPCGNPSHGRARSGLSGSGCNRRETDSRRATRAFAGSHTSFRFG